MKKEKSLPKKMLKAILKASGDKDVVFEENDAKNVLKNGVSEFKGLLVVQDEKKKSIQFF